MNMVVTSAQIAKISLGKGRADICDLVANTITQKGDEYQLDTPLRVKHFLGQTCIESSFFSKLEESLYYSAQRLVQVWPNRFPTIAAATPFANNPQKLANKTYGGRMGNVGPNDGWLYRGSGLPQLTGKDNFSAFTKWMKGIDPNSPDFVSDPDKVRTIDWGIWPALWFWIAHDCASYADKDDAKGLTRAINGGMIGYDDRAKATALAGLVLNVATQPPVTNIKPTTPDPLLMQYQDKMNKISVALKQPSFSPGKADGWNGPATVKAVTAIQSYTKLNADGILGPNTRKAIDLLFTANNLS